LVRAEQDFYKDIELNVTERLAELDAEIKAAEEKYWDHFHGVHDKHGDERFKGGEAQNAAAGIRGKALQDSLDLLRTRRANVAAGFPEDTGIKAPPDIEKIIERKFTAMRKELQGAIDDFCKSAQEAFDDFSGNVHEAYDGLIDNYKAFKADVTKQMTETRSLKYCGTWQKTADYVKNNVITRGGSMWVALVDAPEGSPGSSADWQLCVKSGTSGTGGSA
jgi:hypothetical protein